MTEQVIDLLNEISVLYNRKKNIEDLLKLIGENETVTTKPNFSNLFEQIKQGTKLNTPPEKLLINDSTWCANMVLTWVKQNSNGKKLNNDEYDRLLTYVINATETNQTFTHENNAYTIDTKGQYIFLGTEYPHEVRDQFMEFRINMCLLDNNIKFSTSPKNDKISPEFCDLIFNFWKEINLENKTEENFKKFANKYLSKYNKNDINSCIDDKGFSFEEEDEDIVSSPEQMLNKNTKDKYAELSPEQKYKVKEDKKEQIKKTREKKTQEINAQKIKEKEEEDKKLQDIYNGVPLLNDISKEFRKQLDILYNTEKVFTNNKITLFTNNPTIYNVQLIYESTISKGKLVSFYYKLPTDTKKILIDLLTSNQTNKKLGNFLYILKSDINIYEIIKFNS